MATTPNYGWVTPAPTDYLVDLPADFETFADAVDGDLAGLLGGTTNQVLKKTSNADHAFAWAVDPTTDVVTTAGDLIYGTAADAVTRLGIGTAGQVLTVNSGATAPEWTTINISAQTLLTSGNLSSGTTTISSISGAYNDLILVVRAFDPNTDSTAQWLRFNNDSASNYNSGDLNASADNASVAQIIIQSAVDNGTNDGTVYVYIPQYANTSFNKFCYTTGTRRHATAGGVRMYASSGFWRATNAINQIDLLPSTGTVDGGSYQLWGVK
jgi:hypothetical protein